MSGDLSNPLSQGDQALKQRGLVKYSGHHGEWTEREGENKPRASQRPCVTEAPDHTARQAPYIRCMSARPFMSALHAALQHLNRVIWLTPVTHLLYLHGFQVVATVHEGTKNGLLGS
jgi:hypothetical protein